MIKAVCTGWWGAPEQWKERREEENLGNGGRGVLGEGEEIEEDSFGIFGVIGD